MLPQIPSRCLSSIQSHSEFDVEVRTGNTGSVPPIDPRPIFQLAVEGWVLFAELVQSTLQSNGREMVWARPLLLVCLQAEEHAAIDLEGGPDLLWPAAHFSPAYAEDLLPYMADSVTIPLEAAQQKLRAFVQQVWNVNEGCPAVS